jgi:hypothetical protein
MPEGYEGHFMPMTCCPPTGAGVASDTQLLRRRAEQLLDLASASTDPQIRSLLLTFAAEMNEEADRLEAIAATKITTEAGWFSAVPARPASLGPTLLLGCMAAE